MSTPLDIRTTKPYKQGMSLLDDMVTTAVEAHDPAWAIEATRLMLADHGIPDTVVRGAIMPTLLVVVHHKRFGRMRPVVSATVAAWDPEAQPWDEYKAMAVAAIAGKVAEWIASL